MKRGGVLLTFDFLVADLKKYYSATLPQGAYSIIERFLVQRGFEKTKDSDYLSYSINKIQAAEIVSEFAENNKWFPISLKKLSITPIDKIWDMSTSIKTLYTDEEWKNQKDIDRG